jgi:hypothetical protein
VPDHHWHNELATDLVEKLSHELLLKGGGFGDMMVVLEGVMLGVMLINHNVFNLEPRVAAGLLDDCLQRTTETFTAEMQRKENRA